MLIAGRTVYSIAALLFVSLVCAVGFANAEKRVALVIGNAAYLNTTRLNNPTKDSKDVAAALRRLDFDVTEYHDVDFIGMRKAMKKFGRAARKADMAILYFAGHGMEVGGENWLIPVDADLLSDDEMEDEAIGLSYVMGKLRGASKLGLVILDACRNDPFSNKMTRTSGITRSVNRGFARVEPEGNILVAYAAREGTLAQDGDYGENSPYASALLQHIETPNLDVQFLFRRVRDSVKIASRGVQVPHTYGSLPGQRIFLKTKKIAPDNTAEIAFWNSIKNSEEKSVYDAYLATYKYGNFTKLALARIDLIVQRQDNMRRAMEATLEAERKARAKRLEEQAIRLAEEKRTRLAARNEAELAAKREKLRGEREVELAAKREKQSANRKAELIAERKLSAKRKLALEESQNQRDKLEMRLAKLKAEMQPFPVVPKKNVGDEIMIDGQLIVTKLETEIEIDTKVEPAKPETKATKDTIRTIQKELNRVGCKAGTADGKWGNNSRRSLERFSRSGKIKLATFEPSLQLLRKLKEQGNPVCKDIEPDSSQKHPYDGNWYFVETTTTPVSCGRKGRDRVFIIKNGKWRHKSGINLFVGKVSRNGKFRINNHFTWNGKRETNLYVGKFVGSSGKGTMNHIKGGCQAVFTMSKNF